MNCSSFIIDWVKKIFIFGVVFVVLAGISTLGFFYGYSEGWDQILVENQESDPFFRVHEISRDSAISYLHFFRFRIASLLTWGVVCAGCLVMMRGRRGSAEFFMFIGAILNVVFYGIVITAESREFWDANFNWDSPFGRFAKLSQVLAHLSSMLFAFSLIWKELNRVRQS